MRVSFVGRFLSPRLSCTSPVPVQRLPTVGVQQPAAGSPRLGGSTSLVTFGSSLTMELGRVIREAPLKKGESVWPPREWRKLKKPPTGPEKLVPYIAGAGPSSRSISDFTTDAWFNAYFMLGELLKRPVLPQGLRPAASCWRR